MSWNNKVIWSEGMFLRPQHFQQQTRYLEHYVEGRSGILRSYPWGFSRVQIDRQSLTLGKFGISNAQGAFPDGTPFNIPEDDDPPSFIGIPEQTQNTVVYLGLPLRRQKATEVDSDDNPLGLARYLTNHYEVTDSNAGFESKVQLQIGKLRMRLLLETDKLDDYLCIGMARIAECRSDKHIILDEEKYIPTVLNCQATSVLSDFLKEVQGKLHSRGESLSGRVTTSGRGGVAEIATFLFLQVVNRYEPLIEHLAALEGLHPESLYRVTLEIAGELATFFSENRRPINFPPYRHDDLYPTFSPLITILREYLSKDLIEVATPFELKKRKYGFYKATIEDSNLLSSAEFILVVNADVSAEDLRRHFPNEVQIGPVEKIDQMARHHVPGIRLRPLAVAPRQIPFHTGAVYFELDTHSDEWQELQTSGAIAMHISAEIPGLGMQLWAIRGQ
jgi:type VI secretion system protein ImpJ